MPDCYSCCCLHLYSAVFSLALLLLRLLMNSISIHIIHTLESVALTLAH